MSVIMQRVFKSCALALLFGVCADNALADGQGAVKGVESTPVRHHPWASFGKGSWVRIKSTNMTESAGKQVTRISETKITLLGKSENQVTLENEFTDNGQTIKSKFDVPISNYPEAAPEGMTDQQTGRESITVAGTHVECDTLEGTVTEGGNHVFKRWTSTQVPGALVRSVSINKTSHATAEVIDFKAF